MQGERQMASDNRTLGKFHLEGIPPAPRGMPQIEVTFDIDANGIVHVSAKDKGTGKEQKITISGSSGLSKEDIEKMVREAGEHAKEDERAKERAEARNQADAMVYQAEKNLKEHGSKLADADKEAIQAAIDETKKSLEANDIDQIKGSMEKLQTASHKLAEEIYKQTAQSAPQGEPGAGAAGAKQDQRPPADDVVDAEFVDVDKDK